LNTSYNGVMWKEGFLFTAGRLCLDFTHTGGEGERRVWEALHAPEDLARWFAACSLRADCVTVSGEDLRLARDLREAIWRSAQRAKDGLPPLDGDAAVINRVAAEPPLAAQLGSEGLRWATPLLGKAALSSVARDAIELFADPKAGRVRECANPECALLFVDGSRPGKRRWCSMERCGNRYKTARYRLRRASEEA
jgi:predicted RNA-binding Zn ribbon-like protein